MKYQKRSIKNNIINYNDTYVNIFHSFLKNGKKEKYMQSLQVLSSTF
jgi:hypothetical protein